MTPAECTPGAAEAVLGRSPHEVRFEDDYFSDTRGAYFREFVQCATMDDLWTLARSEAPAVRVYAVEGLAERGADPYAIAESMATDWTPVMFVYADMGEESDVGTFAWLATARSLSEEQRRDVISMSLTQPLSPGFSHVWSSWWNDHTLEAMRAQALTGNSDAIVALIDSADPAAPTLVRETLGHAKLVTAPRLHVAAACGATEDCATEIVLFAIATAPDATRYEEAVMTFAAAHTPSSEHLEILLQVAAWRTGGSQTSDLAEWACHGPRAFRWDAADMIGAATRHRATASDADALRRAALRSRHACEVAVDGVVP
jgi:hypothetical protein